MTREEAKSQVSASQTDDKHPQHAAYRLRTSAYNKWVDSLYASVPGGTERIDLSDGITVRREKSYVEFWNEEQAKLNG